MDPIIGKQLQRAREIRGISLEEAAHHTRMRPAMIEALEAGDIEAFPNRAYAKNFLVLYGKYLRVDVSSVAAQIDTEMQVTIEDYQYLTHSAETTQGPARRGDFARPHSLPSWTPVIALAAVGGIAVFGFMLWLNMSRIKGSPETPLPRTVDSGLAIEPVGDGAQPVHVENQPVKPRMTVAAPTPVISERSVATQAPVENPPEQPPVEQAEPPAAQPERPVAGGSQAPVPMYPKDPPPPVLHASTPPAIANAKPAIIGTPQPEPVTQLNGMEVRPARVISPAARIASNDAALLASVDTTLTAPQTPPPLSGLTPLDEPDAAETTEEESPVAKDPNHIEIEPVRKTWVVIRRETSATPVFEDFLYPTARPMRLPAGKYIIEAREADAIEIRRAGKSIAYTTGGVRIE